MCYHYSIAKTAEEISAVYNLPIKEPGINPEPVCFHANGFNFPLLPIVYKDYKANDLKFEFMNWGLVPAWVKNEEQALSIRGMTLNARADTIDIKPSFRAAYRYRPCLVPATGYFEWMHYKGGKYPFYIYVNDQVIFSFAGIWEEWTSIQTGEIIRSFSIITCEANSMTAKIHNTKKRMPVIIDRKTENDWFDHDIRNKNRKELLKAYEPGKMDAYSIGKMISSRNQDSNVPEVLNPFQYNEIKTDLN